MGINRYSYYSYQRRQKNLPEDPERQAMLEWIKKVAEASQYTYGGRLVVVE
jgi:putative transposase